MARLALIIFTLWMCQLTCTRAGITVIYQDIEYPIVDDEYFTSVDAYLTESNSVAMNATLIKRIPEDATVHAVMLGYSMGEYVLPTCVDINMNLCEVLDEPIILGPVMGVLGLDPDDCPPPPGVYGSENYVVPEDNFPDDFPPNIYLFVIEINQIERTLLRLQISVEVQS